MTAYLSVLKWRRCFLPTALLLALLFMFSVSNVCAQSPAAKKILVFNSYHQAYKWSDDVMSGIVSVLGAGASSGNLQIEYMDAQRIADSGYLKKLSEIYSYKFRDKKFDVIIASDDPAFTFLLKHRHKLFPDTPIVFCGVNYFVESMLNGHKNITGVVEAQDIKATIELALKLHPRTREIYVVNDNTITGQAIAKDLNKVAPLFKNKVAFVPLSGLSMEQIQKKVALLPTDSLILYLIFFEDSTGNKFAYNEGISQIATHSRVPIYGVWDFSLGYGIVGGMLTSGFYQGETAAKQALRITGGETVSTIPVVKQGSNRYMFDSTLLKQFKIKFSDLPADSIIINESDAGRKQVLVLNSYHHGMSWADGVNSGISSVLGRNDKIDLHFEFMDTKRNAGPEYIQKLTQLYRYKFRGKKFDLVIVSDDDAYNLSRKNHSDLFPNVPIVFCGVNFFQPEDLKNDNLITGVVEAVDIRKNLEIALKLHPGIQKIVVINDLTVTGRANRKLIDGVLKDFHSVEFEFLDDINMSELEERVSHLPSDNLILLLSFNRDKSNNVFSYEESIRRVAAKARVPIYGVWDFYLGSGIVGGMLTNGFSQGEMAAKLGLRVLDGEKPDKIPVVQTSPNRYMFDYHYLNQFGVETNKLPGQSEIINRPNIFLEKYGKTAAILLSVIAVIACYILYRRKKSRDLLTLMEATDPLTGVLNRRAGLAYLKQLIKSANVMNTNVVVCFVDLDSLKFVNDTYGHLEGDRYLREASQILQQKTRKGDLLCRYGGDEFLMAISNCTLGQAERLWGKVEESATAFNLGGEAQFTISMSRGFVEYNPALQFSILELVEMADAEMYKFKQKRKAENSIPK